MKPKVVYAGFWWRALAGAIDLTVLNVAAWLIQMAILGALYWIRVGMGDKSLLATGISDSFNWMIVEGLNAAVYIGISIPYYVTANLKYGTTLGKRAFRIYVVNAEDGMPITRRQAWIRWASYLVSYLPLGTGYLMAAFHPEKKALHDIFARTISVRKLKA
jgi:uncharacterized RDD family membrane protein YckC